MDVVATTNKAGWRRNCPTPAPTPTSAAAPFAAFGANQVCIEAQPWDEYDSGRMLARRSLGPADSPEECYDACYSAGLTPEFYFAVMGGECYCCQTW